MSAYKTVHRRFYSDDACSTPLTSAELQNSNTYYDDELTNARLNTGNPSVTWLGRCEINFDCETGANVSSQCEWTEPNGAVLSCHWYSGCKCDGAPLDSEGFAAEYPLSTCVSLPGGDVPPNVPVSLYHLLNFPKWVRFDVVQVEMMTEVHNIGDPTTFIAPPPTKVPDLGPEDQQLSGSDVSPTVNNDSSQEGLVDGDGSLENTSNSNESSPSPLLYLLILLVCPFLSIAAAVGGVCWLKHYQRKKRRQQVIEEQHNQEGEGDTDTTNNASRRQTCGTVAQKVNIDDAALIPGDNTTVQNEISFVGGVLINESDTPPTDFTYSDI